MTKLERLLAEKFRCTVLTDSIIETKTPKGPLMVGRSVSVIEDRHIQAVPYFLPQMRLVVWDWNDEDDFNDQLYAENGYYTLALPFDRLGRCTQMIDQFMHTVHWTQITEGLDETFLHEPKLFGDVGHDLAANKTLDLAPHEMTLVPCNVRIQMPPNLYARIVARSSTSRKRILIPEGILDAGYRGDIFVQAVNMTPDSIPIDKGDRIAQIIFQERFPVHLQKVTEFWYPTERGGNGFGSTNEIKK